MSYYTPPDVEEAWAAWRASCGPAAVAAILGRPVMGVRELFPGYRGWVNFTGIANALRLAGAEYRKVDRLRRGLAFIQLAGPWTEPGVPIAAAYRHTHWVAVDHGGRLVYDVNAREWLPRPEWEAEIVPALLGHDRGATGWWVRYRLEVAGPKEGRA